MAPHWTLALLLVISALLKIGQAAIFCESDQCVAKNMCRPSTEYRSNAYRCSNNKVCCANEDIQNDQSCKRNKVCVPEYLCRTELEYRSLDQCPDQLICCKVEDGNNLSIEDRL